MRRGAGGLPGKIRPGYAALLRGEEVDIVTGKPTEDDTTDR